MVVRDILKNVSVRRTVMNETPAVRLGQLISVGGNHAIISKIYPARKNTVEIVYLLQGLGKYLEKTSGISSSENITVCQERAEST